MSSSQSTNGRSRPSYPQYQTSNTSTPQSAFSSSTSSTASAYSTYTTTYTTTSATSQPSLQRLAPQRQNSASAPLPSPHAQQPQYAQFASVHPSQAYQPQRGVAGQTAAETGAYLNQYSLVAEAARRAQMACLERDLNGMEM